MKKLILTLPFLTSFAFAEGTTLEIGLPVETQTQNMSVSQNQNGISLQENNSFITRTPTAAEQGYVAEGNRITWEEAHHIQEQANNARQQAIQVKVAYEGQPISKIKKKAKFVEEWAEILESVGVSKDRTYFEANRLNEEDFIQWANGTYNAYGLQSE